MILHGERLVVLYGLACTMAHCGYDIKKANDGCCAIPPGMREHKKEPGGVGPPRYKWDVYVIMLY